jgi:hypothetical protein
LATKIRKAGCEGARARLHFMRCDDFSFSRQISSTNSVLRASRWYKVTVQGLV